MIIHSLRARRWRGISDSGELELQPGFNLLSGPNGSGKSSLLESMLMTFFVKHTSKNAETRAIEPLTGGGSPESDIIFSFDGQKWKVHKRFLKDSVCELWRMERGEFNHVANGDEADALLRGFLQASGGGPQQVLSKHRGLAQALWSLQRDVELLPAESWCESVSVALSGTVRQVAQDPIYRAVCKLIEDTFDRHWTGTGKVKKGSSQEVEDDKLVAIRKELSELRVQRDKAEDHRETLERIEIELTPLVEHLQEAGQEEEDARAAVARSEALQPQLAALQAQLREATQEVEIVEAIQLGRNKAQTNQERLVELEQRKVQAEAKFSAQVSLAESELQRQITALASTRQNLETAEIIVERVERATNLARLERDLLTEESALNSLRRAQDAVRRSQESWSEHRAPKSKEINDFRKRRDEILRKEAEHRASAIQVSFALEGGHEISSAPMLVPAHDGTWLLSGPTIFRVGTLGTISIQGPVSTTAELEVEIRELRAKNQSLLSSYNVDSEEALAQLLETEKGLSQELERCKKALSELDKTEEEELVADIAALKAQIAALRQQIEADTAVVPPGTTLAGCRIQVKALRDQEARERLDQSHRQEAVDTARQGHTDAKVELEGVRTELRGTQARLAELVLQHGNLAQLEARLQAARLSLSELRLSHDKLAGELGPALEAATMALGVARRRVQDLESKKRNLEDSRTRTESVLEQMLLQNIHESIADLEVLEEQQARRTARVRREAEAAKLLRELADTLVTEQTQVLIGPIAERVTPWLHRLTGGRYRDLSLSEAVLPSDVVLGHAGKRIGTESLSHGTREQLAVLVRLAMGQLLSANERQLLVLDDRLVNSDSLRLARLRPILEEVSATCQVLVATCDDTNYAGIRSNVIRMQSP